MVYHRAAVHASRPIALSSQLPNNYFQQTQPLFIQNQMRAFATDTTASTSKQKRRSQLAQILDAAPKKQTKKKTSAPNEKKSIV